MKSRSGLAGALVAGAIALSPAAPAWANPILVGPTNAATGINGLVLNFGPGPITYDVTFLNAAFTSTGINLFNTNNVQAIEEASALSNTLTSLGVTGLTGATPDSSIGLLALVPFALTGNPTCSSASQPAPCVEAEAAQSTAGFNWQETSGWVIGESITASNADYAVFTVETVPVPGPLVGGGVPGLIFAASALLGLGLRRRSRQV